MCVVWCVVCVCAVSYGGPCLCTQDFSFTDLQQIVYEDDLCLDVPRGAVMTKVDIQMCHYMGGNQKWDYRNKVSWWSHAVTWELLVRGLECVISQAALKWLWWWELGTITRGILES